MAASFLAGWQCDAIPGSKALCSIYPADSLGGGHRVRRLGPVPTPSVEIHGKGSTFSIISTRHRGKHRDSGIQSSLEL